MIKSITAFLFIALLGLLALGTLYVVGRILMYLRNPSKNEVVKTINLDGTITTHHELRGTDRGPKT